MTISLEPASPAHRLYLSQLAIYLRHSRQILAAWDLYSDRHSDPETFQPHDEDAYGRRQQKRDADTLSAFGRVYYHADELVDVAERQLADLAPSDRTRRYAWQVRELRDATQRLCAVHDDWRAVRAALPESARPGTKAYEDPLAESYAEAWSYLDQWAIHGQALFAVNALAQWQSNASALALPATVPAHKAAATSSRVRR
ncbi:hypothetical protein [Streptomyces viridochromogenes]|uniref:Uncharacterized protein n=1 Tax=Streptomyces viridochromogenes Tue57 TaxID=1160705 RepID=L8PI46_STRVR|nr:hypothetical protein [Streptomyces viridochromogenes]ELS55904.1 hypothetical protein STVIR_3249 [Streptomyces viridochromogenes Tue57]